MMALAFGYTGSKICDLELEVAGMSVSNRVCQNKINIQSNSYAENVAVKIIKWFN